MTFLLVTAAILTCAAAGARANASQAVADIVRATERERLRALVDADIAVASIRHAPHFRVINPLGREATKDEYLSAVASGVTDYLAWEPGPIEVRLDTQMAAIRYRSRVELTVRGTRLPPMHAWNMGLYVKRAGRWQIVWFQVTEIATPRQ